MNRHDLCMQRVIYNRISLFRADNGMSRKDLADKVGVNPQTIGFLERGDYKPSLELAMMLAGIFGVRLEMLFSFQPFPSVAHTLGHTGD
ncbi:helix-turn-helix transcriptional regulator [Novosphingobium acidiphilum]|uniref:helix-turn-helix transcriptional regulator n=1 Tax=Novosphingobium acidiphilum TaxID=505248 RepID=UPI001FE1AD95|nr:helix-turn-helix transcriptional regulator [Novosphingobium acidiphilum]